MISSQEHDHTMTRNTLSIALLLLAAGGAWGQQVQPEEFTLDNGMKFLLLQRSEEPNLVAAGWVAKVGSVNERPGITGMSHFFEHLMFKGTDTIGTSDPVADAAFTDRERGLRNAMLEITWGEQYDRFRAGEIDDPWDADNDTPRLAELREELKAAMEEHRSVIVKDEFASVYQAAGATGLNAFTTYDLTFYINQLPANKFELWCWMESDRLANSVFREFFSERDVVHEERRMRTESSPTGEFDEQFEALFWQGSPYSWPVIGWPSDLNSYTLEEAQRYFDIYYRPNNLVGVVVGDFDPEAIRALIETYFGRLERGSTPVPPIVTIEPDQKAQQRLSGEVDAQSQIKIRYHTPPMVHRDAAPLSVMAALLNGRTGRLYKSMVEGSEVASSASAAGPIENLRKHAGMFSFTAAVKGDATPEDLEAGWYDELTRLQEEPVGDRELQKIKNQVIADQYRSLTSNFLLMIQLGFLEAMGDWNFLNEAPPRLLAVTPEDIRRVANTYFTPENLSIALYYRSEDAPEVDDALAGLDPQAQMMVQQAISQLEPLGVMELNMALQQMAPQAAMVPEEMKPAFDYILNWVEQRIVELGSTDTPTADEPAAPEPEIEPSPIEEVPASPAVGEAELTPQQMAQADQILANLEGKPLSDLIQIHGILNATSGSVSDEERPMIEYVIAALQARIDSVRAGDDQ